MRLPFPDRVSLPLVVLYAIGLVGLQQLQHTSLIFSLYTFLFIVIAAITFNAAGGLTSTSGGYVFFYSILAVILGINYKAYLGEPADSNLLAPILTIQVHTAAIAAMLVAVFVSRRLTGKRALLQTLVKDKDLKNATVGCIVCGTGLSLAGSILPHDPGSIMGALLQLNRFLSVGVILGTVHAFRRSGGRTAFSIWVLWGLGIGTFFGIISFSKEGIFSPVACWLVTACSLRLRVKPYQIIVGLLLGAVSFMYLVPFSQVGRNYRVEGGSFSENLKIALTLFTDLPAVRETYLTSERETHDVEAKGYYDTPQGFFDRLTMLSADDSLINYTAQGHIYGLQDLPNNFLNWIPHFLWPNKPSASVGNSYAREIGGIVGEEDTTTGISFSAPTEGFHWASWFGVVVVAPIIWIMLFTVFDSLCGDTRKSPWGLLMIAYYAHAGPEGSLGALIYAIAFVNASLVFCAFLSAHLMPIIGTLIVGPEQSGITVVRKPRGAARPVTPQPN